MEYTVVSANETNIISLIQNNKLFIETSSDLKREVPIGDYDNSILAYAKSYSSRIATVTDIDLILSFTGKRYYITDLPALKLESTFTAEEVTA